MSYEPINTRSPATTGDDLISALVLNVQRRRPSGMLNACSVPPRAPTNTACAPTAGDDSPIDPPVAYFQRSFPVSKSRARRSPAALPTYTLPLWIAPDDWMASPAS